MIQDKEHVTVAIATHNNATTIKRALDSVTTGIRPANQIIVGDNDSQDGTYDTLCNLIGAEQVEIDDKKGLPPQASGTFNDVPIIIFRKRLSTRGHTINQAIQMKWQGATIFGFLDPTSWYAPDKISQAIVAFQSHPSIACVVSDWDNHYSDNHVERVFRPSFDMQRFLAEMLYDDNFLVRPQIFARLKSGFNEQLPSAESYELMLRISEVGLIYHIPAPLHNNVVVNVGDQQTQELRQVEHAIRQAVMQKRQE